MDKNIKLVIHCGESSIELDAHTLEEHGVLDALKNHYSTKPDLSWWQKTFEMLADLLWYQRDDETMRGEAFHEQLTIALGRETPLQRAMSRELHQQLSMVEAD